MSRNTVLFGASLLVAAGAVAADHAASSGRAPVAAPPPAPIAAPASNPCAAGAVVAPATAGNPCAPAAPVPSAPAARNYDAIADQYSAGDGTPATAVPAPRIAPSAENPCSAAPQ